MKGRRLGLVLIACLLCAALLVPLSGAESTNDPSTPASLPHPLALRRSAAPAKPAPPAANDLSASETTDRLRWATLLGGDNDDAVLDVAVCPDGGVILVGYTSGFDLTGIPGFDTVYSGEKDGFVTKISPSLTEISWHNYIGGSALDWVAAVAVNGSGWVFFAATTYGSGFTPTYGQFTSGYDAYVGAISPDGLTLAWDIGLGAGSNAYLRDIALTPSSYPSVVVVGDTRGTSYPLAGDTINDTIATENSTDVVVSVICGNGTTLRFSTYIGGSGVDFGYGVAVTSSGSLYAVGYTNSTDFPATAGAHNTTNSGDYDAWAAHVDWVSGTTTYTCTYLGGGARDRLLGLDTDGDVAYVVGDSQGQFPVSAGAWNTTHQTGTGTDMVVASLDEDCTLLWATYLGGRQDDSAKRVAYRPEDHWLYVVGNTTEAPGASGYHDYGFPATVGNYMRTVSDSAATLSVLGADGDLLQYSTTISGNKSDDAGGIAIINRTCLIAGSTAAPSGTDEGWPTTAGAPQEVVTDDLEGWCLMLGIDGEAPRVAHVAAPDEIAEDQVFLLTATITDTRTDDTGLAGAWVVVNGTERALTQTDADSSELYFASNLSVGTWEWRLAAVDNARNWRNHSLSFVVVVPAHTAPTAAAVADKPDVIPPYEPPPVPVLTWYTVVAVLTTLALLFAGRLPPLSRVKVPQLAAVVLVLALGAFVQSVALAASVAGAWPAWQLAVVYGCGLSWALLTYFFHIHGLAAGGIAVFATLAVLSFVATASALSVAALGAWSFVAAAGACVAVVASPLLGVRLGVVLPVALAALAVFLLATYSIALALVWF